MPQLVGVPKEAFPLETRFVRSIKEECLDRMIFVGQVSLRRAVSECIDHCHAERNHHYGHRSTRLDHANMRFAEGPRLYINIPQP